MRGVAGLVLADRNQRNALRLELLAKVEEVVERRWHWRADTGEDAVVEPQYVRAVDVDRHGPLVSVRLRDLEELARERAVPTLTVVQEVDGLHPTRLDVAVE